MLVLSLAFLLVNLGTCLAPPLAAPEPRNRKDFSNREEFASREEFPSRGPNAPAPLFDLEHDTKIPNEYIVIFRRNHTLKQHYEAIGTNFSNSPRFYDLNFLPGYAAQMDDKTLHDLVRRDSGVLLVDTNREVHLIEPVYRSEPFDASEVFSSHHRMAERDYTQETQQDAPYGLQMLAGGGKLPTPVGNGGNYDFVRGAGNGVQAYILDTGIRISHKLFQGRASNLGGLKPTDRSPYVDETMNDINGHGTHVAGTVGAQQYGVAPYADLINVKVLGNGGSKAGLAAAIGDVTKDHNAKKGKKNKDPFIFRGSVINMSLEFEGVAWSVLWALVDATNAGIGVFAAAGNSNKDSSNTYPCSLPTVNCVAAVDKNYEKAIFSNYGSKVEYIGPGVDIASLGIKNDDALQIFSGTSQATPHVTGAGVIFTFCGLTTGFPSSQDNLFVTTGIHSPKKYPKEPFRWARDWPVKNHQISNVFVGDVQTETATPSPVPASLLMTGYMSGMSYTTDAPVSGLYLNSTVVTAEPSVSFVSGAPIATPASSQVAPDGCSIVAPSATLCS